MLTALREADQPVCPHCDTVLSFDLFGGLCEVCALRGARKSRVPPSVGGYEILAELGRGGMGVVYRARQRVPDREVALKMILSGEFAADRELASFRREVEILGRLDHPNIVRVYEGRGEHDGHPFYTMQLIEGGTLAAAISRTHRREPRESARLLLTIARAVEYGHAQPRPVLHLDLKPGNILLSSEGHPYIADFGLARLVGAERSGHSGTFAVVGTPEYMAPERLLNGCKEPNASWDVYSLGAMLYELFTRRPPYQAESLPALIDEIVSGELVPPRRRCPEVPRDLERVCLTALERDTARRYATVRDFADDLERALLGYPIRAKERSWPVRLWRWAGRHPLVASGASAVIALLVTMTIGSLQIAAKAAHDQRRLVRDDLRWEVEQLAGRVLSLLHEYADRLERAARDPAIRDVGARGLSSYEATVLRPFKTAPFHSMVLFALDGRPLARVPPAKPSYYAQRFRHRDYFRVALERAGRGIEGAYLGGEFLSQADQVYKFALSSAVSDRSGAPVGVLMASLEASSTLGRARRPKGSMRERVAVLLGPRDRGSSLTAERRDELVILVHPGLERARRSAEPQREFVLPWSETVQLRGMRAAAAQSEPFYESLVEPVELEDHRDPLPGYDAGSWLAAFAPVGGTGYVAMIQVRDEATYRPTVELMRELGLKLALPCAAALLAMCMIAVWDTRRRPRGLRARASRDSTDQGSPPSDRRG